MSRTRHRHPEDRFSSTLRPRRELLEALWNLAYWDTNRRRRRRRAPRVSIFDVEIWVQASQARLIRRYQAHLAYLRAPASLSRRTLSRQVAGFRRLKLLMVTHPGHYDRRRARWVHQDNIYTITHAGKLWIKRHARATKIPSVV